MAAGTTDKNIESALIEKRSFPPAPEFTARARIKPPRPRRVCANAPPTIM